MQQHDSGVGRGKSLAFETKLRAKNGDKGGAKVQSGGISTKKRLTGVLLMVNVDLTC